MTFVHLDHQKNRLKIDSFEVENEIVLTFFDKLPADQRDETLFRALYIGVLALMEDRFASFLSRTQSELGVQLESLKLIFEMKKELFLKSASKGVAGEELIFEVLNDYLKERRFRDQLQLIGTAPGLISRNKTGDILCILENLEDKKIVIECKFDKSIRLGDIADKDVFNRNSDSAWSQLLEADANRGSAAGIIVFDVSSIDRALLDYVENVRYVAPIGFLVVIDVQKGNFNNLFIAYGLARDIVLHAREINIDPNLIDVLIRRLIKDLDVFTSIRSLVERNMEANREILKQLHKSFLMVQFCHAYLSKYLKDGQLSKKDLLEFYNADEVKSRFKEIEENLVSDEKL